jgi:predicted ATPase/class 3 adenylate cyclase
MKCPKCQFENEEEAKFCLDCGERLEIECPQCGKIFPLWAKFCNQCGQDLRKVTEALPIDFDQPQSYTPKFLADKILNNRSAIEGERKLVTVLFADVANYTSMAEKLDPEEVHQIMDGCFKILMDEIHRYEGTINQFTGDGVMALFGAPVAHEDHAQRACYAALSIQKAIGEHHKKIKEDRGVNFLMRIGLNSGPVIVGSIGDDLRMDYTAVGDTTNLASRMEGMAMPGTILVARETFKLARDFFEFESLGKVELKGKEKLLEAYKLFKAGEVETRIEASVAKGLTRFVGRKNSMAALREALEEAKAGSGQVVGVVGEAGVGKSRILLEFKNPLPQNEYVHLEGRCFQYGVSMSYLPFLDILRIYFDIKEGDQEFIIKKKMADKIAELDEKLENALSPLMELLSLKVEDEDFIKLEPQQKRQRTFEAIRNLLIRISQERPLVLAVEDMHWIDKTSEEFLSYLIGSLANTHILLVLLYRPEYTHQWGSKSYYRKIGLNQLTVKSSAELVHAILEGGNVSPEIIERILNRTSGNPLYMEELTHSLLENGSIQKKDHQFVLSVKGSEIQVPDTIQGIIAARMDRLEDSLKRTMQVASVIGRDFAFRILQTITGLREELKAHLLNLQGLEFIYEKSLFPELEYIFKHALTQEVAYNSLLLKRRKEIHEKIGEAIEQIYAERLEEFYEMLAYHFVQGEVWHKAVIYLRQAGGRAMKKSAYVEAIAHLRKGLEVFPRLPETADRAELELALQFDLAASLIVSKGGSAHEVEQAYARALELCRQVGETPKLIPVLQGLRRLYSLRGERGDGQRARELGEQLLTLAQRQNDTALLQEAHWALGQTLYYLGELNPARTHLEQSSAFYKPQSLSSQVSRFAAGTQIACLVHMAWALWALGYPDQALETGHEAISLAHELSHPFTLAFAFWGMAQLNQYRREVQATLERAEATITLSKEQGFPLWVDYGTPLLAWTLVMQGKTEEGIAQIRQIMANKPTAGISNAAWTMVYALLVEAYGAAGQTEEGLDMVAEALALVEKTGFRYHEAEIVRLQGELLLKQAAPDSRQAETCLHRALDLARRQQAKSLELRAAVSLSRLWHRHGKKEEACRLLKEIYGWFTEGFDTPDLQKAKALLEELM